MTRATMKLDITIDCALFPDGDANHGNNAIELAARLEELARLLTHVADRLKPNATFPVLLETDEGLENIGSMRYYTH